jgi:hypothetical protein
MARVRTPRLPVMALLVGALVVAAACGSSSTVSPSVAPTGSLVPPLTGQTDTEWGRIWDTIPADFPVYAGATEASEAATGPTSAELAVFGSPPERVIEWTAKELTAGGYAISGGTAPLEDGSYSIEATGDAGCRVLVTAAPLGGMTAVSILYGAECPNT